ncbi:MAG: hypothetical protein GXY85_01605 [Candidatus Brocadiaceae bacterium]|nr:hypothetical protein [Candidatus Brocadiaceae bacterium]
MTSPGPGRHAGVSICGMGLVLPGPTPGMLPSVPSPRLAAGPVYSCRELPALPPRYARALRRLCRADHLALAAAVQAVGDRGGQEGPDDETAVCVGTGMGVVGATAAFLESMVEENEGNPKPTAFTNSLHNVPAAQIAVYLGLRGPNNTFIHGSVSFELALWRALRMMETGQARRAVVVGVDEASPYVVTAGQRRGWFRGDGASLDPMAGSAARVRGTVPGEGAGALLLCRESDAPQGRREARLAGLRIEPPADPRIAVRDPDAEAEFVVDALESAGVAMEDVDLLLLGANGDCRIDDAHRRVVGALARSGRVSCGVFKSSCGEFCAAAAVGVVLGAMAVRDGALAPAIRLLGRPVRARAVSCVACYNLYETGYRSLCVVKA